MELEIYEPSKEGYEVKHRFGDWRIAYLCYADRFDNITYLERHMKTDEIFVLLSGQATLFIGEQMTPTEMIPGKMYNVKQAVWHNIKVSKEAVVMIVEDRDTAAENSEYLYL